MSPARTRARAYYGLLGLTLLVLAANVAMALYLNALRHDIEQAQGLSYAGCVRGNVLREVARFALVELDSPARARLPELQKLDCEEIYPGGGR